MNNAKDIINFLQYETYKHVSPITKNNSNMHLIDSWSLQIILIVTSICKGEVKFIAFSYELLFVINNTYL